jgi:large subunit ribosomal protein L22
MEVQAITKYVHLSPSKARDLAGRLRGLAVADALRVTTVSERKAAGAIGKTLQSALANAETNADLSVDNLRVKSASVDMGPAMKRAWSRARGMVSPIKKRMCHIKIVLTDGQKKV